ncbi:MAG: aldehyde ferredoxin oxidoreductase family protein, partial [Spirochaetota bacterium]
MEEIIGAINRVMDVDLTSRQLSEIKITPEELELFLGGKGLGLKLLYDRLKTGIDPLGEENILAFMLGVMVGSGAPCSGRWAAVTKSPLTGIMTSSSCGGPFGMACKTAGYDGILIRGRSSSPVYLEIEDKGVSFQDAGHLWGKTTSETLALLKLGKADGSLVIGPGGENKVLYANIASGHRYLGRGGMGAVMGSKNLKALVARGGTYTIVPVKKEKFEKLKKKAVKFINRNRYTSVLYRKYGTCSYVYPCNKNGLLPVNNFRLRTDARAVMIAGETMAEKYNTRPSSCKPCSIVCGHKGTYPDGTLHQIPEYETTGVLGPNLGIFDTEAITEWNDLCGELGIDTVSTGTTLSYIMEAGEKGLIETGLQFGSTAGISGLIRDIAYRKGFGDEVADGTRRLSEKYGGADFAINVKGLELAAYDPRGAWGQGLSYAVANRGGCHLSSYPVALEVFYGYLNPYSTRGKAKWVRFLENLYAAVNSLHTCQFTAYAYIMEQAVPKYVPKPFLVLAMSFIPAAAQALMNLTIYSNFYEYITGIKMPVRRFLRAGERIHILERYMNNREGITKKDDTLPERFLKEGKSNYPVDSVVPIGKLVKDYYKARDYNPQGIPEAGRLKKLSIPPDEESGYSLHSGKCYPGIQPGKKPF